MPDRHPALDELLHGLQSAFLEQNPDPSLKLEVLGAFSAMGLPSPAGTAEPASIDACEHLEPALAIASREGSPDIHAVAAAFATIAPKLAWARRKGSEKEGPAFHDGHANAILIGPNGFEARSDVWLGVSLMAPGVQYPVHRHPPDELYVVLSEGDWFREGDGWFTPGLGGTVYNSPNVVHSMRSGHNPLLAFWLLWSDDGVAL